MSLIERIFSNVSPETFLSKHWLYEPLHCRGDLSRLPELKNAPALANVEDALGMDCRSRRLDSPDQDGENFVQHQLHPSVEECRSALNKGQTIYLGGLQETPFPAYNDQLAAELDLPLALEGLYLERFWLAFAAKPSKGLRWHWDRHHLLIIQIHGEKRFKVAKNKFFAYPNVPPVGYDSWIEGMSPTLCGALGRSSLHRREQHLNIAPRKIGTRLPVNVDQGGTQRDDAPINSRGCWCESKTQHFGQ